MRVGLALKGVLGKGGGDLFAAWSAQSGKDDPAFTAKTWAGLKADRIGAGTIYHLAMERGWKPDAGLVLDGDAPGRRCIRRPVCWRGWRRSAPRRSRPGQR